MRKRPLCAAAILLLCIQAILAGGFQIAPDLKPSALELEGKGSVSLEGTVYRREEKPDYKVFYLRDNQVLMKNKFYQESKILVYIETENHISIGNRIKISGEADTFQEARNPGNFNQKFYYQKQGIHVSVWADKYEKKEDSVYAIREWLAALRGKWKGMLVEQLGDYYGNSMSAILLGDKSGLDSELKELYQKSGIGHILAISGLHMSFLGVGLYQLLRKSGLPFLFSGLVGAGFLFPYTLMIGSGVSSQRALVMFLIRMGAEVTGRTYDMPTSLSVAAVTITLRQPLYLMDAGFLLSFGAIAGIAFLYPVLGSYLKAPGSGNNLAGGHGDSRAALLGRAAAKQLINSIRASLAVNLLLFPAMLYFYFEFPAYSLLLNLLVIPLMPLVLGAGIGGSVLSLFGTWAGRAVLHFCSGVLWLYEKCCSLTLGLPFSRIVTGRPGKAWICIYYLLLLCFCAWTCCLNSRSANGKKQKCSAARAQRSCTVIQRNCIGTAAILAFWIGMSLLCSMKYSGHQKLAITMLDVGQGDGIYIKGPTGQNYFIDGGSSDVQSVGRYRIAPFLRACAVQTLDYVFISHGDTDHLNGVEEILKNQILGIRIKNLVLPSEKFFDEKLEALAKTAEESGTRVVAMEAGEELTEHGLRWKCIAPLPDYSGPAGNEASMVLEMHYGKLDVLFTGDLGKEGEEQLEKSGALMKYDIVKAGHHGSKNSSSAAFLRQAAPSLALISAGIENRYGHPHEETLTRLKEVGSAVYSTQNCGAVTVLADGDKITLERQLGK